MSTKKIEEMVREWQSVITEDEQKLKIKETELKKCKEYCFKLQNKLREEEKLNKELKKKIKDLDMEIQKMKMDKLNIKVWNEKRKVNLEKDNFKF